MAKKKLKVGVIGTGAIARDKHLPNWKELAGEGRVEIAGVCDIIKERAQTIADTFGAQKAFTDYEAMFKSESFDIIDICTQNRLHCPIAVAALKSGANVLVEKPMAMNAQESKKMIAAANAAKRKLMVAQHMRFQGDSEKIKDIIQQGTLGQIYACKALLVRRRLVPGWGKFHIKKESLGGPLIDLGVHMLDLAIWLLGNPKPIAASGKVYTMFGDREDLCNAGWADSYPRKEFDVEDYASAYIRFENNITLYGEYTWAVNMHDQHYIQIMGDKAGICTNPAALYGYQNNTLTTTKLDWVPQQDPHRMEIRHFTECIEHNRPVRVQPEESLQIQKIIDAIYESSIKNREILIK